MDEIERRIEEFKKLTNSVREEAKNLREVALCQVREEEEKKEEKKKRHYEEELKHKEAKLKVKRNHEKKLQEDLNKPSKECGVKLPRLTITKFQRTHLAWLRFWSQYETEIDKAGIMQLDMAVFFWRPSFQSCSEVLILGAKY